ncbi:hypothetical protein GPECTOR_41g615 [Gonium pectorale]|uniref:Uncharacterized protein n=1 Tax=Gonium pectorale TaxID=33097 RepID=A0A150G9Y7_GONPE|nr:hypothetical protein GPECTOR_41g615 [Gonium pectorale]|eukprot:KXZ46651.1 hypothetical protein GPECTOR_41g615 [Gonium pectorale]
MRAIALFAVLGVASVSALPDQNSWSFMLRQPTGAQCATRYTALIEQPYYSNDPTCAALVKTAITTYNVSACPSTKPLSQVWKCMNGWNGTVADAGRVNAWVTFLTNCELLYIAQRLNSAESESGFVWQDNSCFARYNGMGAFASYLTSTTPGSAGSIFVSMLHVLLAVVAALLLLR